MNAIKCRWRCPIAKEKMILKQKKIVRKLIKKLKTSIIMKHKRMLEEIPNKNGIYWSIYPNTNVISRTPPQVQVS